MYIGVNSQRANMAADDDMNDEHELTTFSGKHYSKDCVDCDIKQEEALSACVYRDFGQWRPVADFRTRHRIIKFASQELFAEQGEAEIKADELVDELMHLLGIPRRDSSNRKS